MKTRIFYILLFISIIRLHAQSTNKGENSLGTWYAVTTASKVSDKFSISGSLTNWNYKIVDNQHLLLAIIGLNYKVNNAVSFGIGYGYGSIDTSFEETGDPYIIENRTIEQISVKYKVYKFSLSHRFKLEQRFIEYETQYKFKNRIRYRFKSSFPINKRLSITFYDEIHYHLINGLDFHQNRAYAGLGVKINKNMNFQFGYARHSYKTKSFNRLSAQLNLKFDFRKAKI
ncbi:MULTISPECIES: DUF2490 domain-containing protein [unclassified Polaribacter]|jgi:hypothetical protein|uniref:DUF2490 domain-containing protein n=1 Tax=unclassified Polaribacter TaxID=196858 RepID=UPI00052CC566|nr:MULTISPECIES: DUF2490 domain-containing protein [unclassified Polaribacter]KGL61096.1 hypothetical protein PHEL49_1994 [Polaribacter sp. Hel1_33_49]PKV64619.1 uncharacterized protein DUF2490 [Polaribacter sp. Hel1_33_96]